MPSSRAIKPKRDDSLLSNWESMPDRAPSLERADTPVVARVLAMIGLFFLVLGVLSIVAVRWQRVAAISPGFGFFLGSIGLGLILFHAFSERDQQFRRLYGFLGIALVLGGVLTRLMAFRPGYESWFILGGGPALIIGLIILVAVIRNEAEAQFRMLMTNIVGGVGALTIAFAILNGMRVPDFLPGEGFALLILGLLYVGAFIGLQDNSERAYQAGLALGGVGILGFATALVRSLLPDSTFLVPGGLILMGMSLVYLVIALGICVDWPIIVLARRELASYFFSPIAYLVFVGQLIFGWGMFWNFVSQFSDRGGLPEPIVRFYIFGIFPVFGQMFFVPALTMRLLSEEKRSGTLEVLLTAPVNEISVVLGKFLASWIFYLLLWVPWLLFLVSLRYMGHEEFDYRPILSFGVALGVISAGLLSMGLFFSSLTSNQLIAAVFTFVAMMAHLLCYFMEFQIARPGSAISTVLNYVNFFDLWTESLEGGVAPRFLMFHLSVAIVFLFATIKVLESRKWK